MIRIYKNKDITSLTTFRFPVIAKKYIELETSEDIHKLDLNEIIQPLLILGYGSNLFFEKKVFKGTILKFTGNQWKVVSENDEFVSIEAMSDLRFDTLVEETIKLGYFGLENLSRIPSSVGASAIQNIGAYGVEAKELIESVTGYFISNKKKKTLSNHECKFKYRSSIFKEKKYSNFLITSVTFKLSKKFIPNLSYPSLASNFKIPPNSAREIREFLVAFRDARFPDWNLIGNVGSFFKNPVIKKSTAESIKKEYPDLPIYPTEKRNLVKISAGFLVEKSGFKGYKYKKVGVSSTHGLILENYGGENKDMKFLINKITKKVLKDFNIQLDPEAIIIK